MNFTTLFLGLISLLATQLNAQEVLKSGPSVGEELWAFDPRHVSGPDKRKKVCPMCKYGSGQGVLIWWNTDDEKNIRLMLERLEADIAENGLQKIRVFVMYMNPSNEPAEVVEKRLVKFSEASKLDKVAVTYIPNPTDEETAGTYRINPDPKVRNTVIVYKKRTAYSTMVNFVATERSMQELISKVHTRRSITSAGE